MRVGYKKKFRRPLLTKVCSSSLKREREIEGEKKARLIALPARAYSRNEREREGVWDVVAYLKGEEYIVSVRVLRDFLNYM